MPVRRAEQLTSAQKECLRLVLTRHNSKEIAALVGVSPSAVDKRIERAVQILGVGNRFAAARALAEFEGERSGSVPETVGADGPVTDAEGRAVAIDDDLGDTCERTTSEPIDLPPNEPSDASIAADGPRWSVAQLFGMSPDAGEGGGVRNPLGRLQRLGIISMVIVAVALTTMALLNMGQTLSVLLARHG